MAVRISPVRRTITVTIYIQVSCVDLEFLALDLPAPLQADGVCRGNGVSGNFKIFPCAHSKPEPH